MHDTVYNRSRSADQSQFLYTPAFIGRRDANSVRLGISPELRSRHGAERIIVENSPLELTDRLSLTPLRTAQEKWGPRTVNILYAAAEIIPFKPENLTRVEGVPLANCRGLQQRFGPDYPALIAKNSTLLSTTRYSKIKCELIARLCQEDFKLDKKTKADLTLIRQMCGVGISKPDARDLASRYDPKQGPYQFVLTGELKFRTGDKLAMSIDPSIERASPARIKAIIASSFLDNDSTLLTRGEISEWAELNYGVPFGKTRDALDALRAGNFIREHEGSFALTKIFDQEKFLSQVAASNEKIDLDPDTRDLIRHVIDHAGEFTGKQDFVLDDAQIAAIWQTFENKLSIITGPPGSGKTALATLINFIGTAIYKKLLPPVYGMALAGRAASNLRQAATAYYRGKIFPLQAATIHRSLQISNGDGDPLAANKFETGALILDECSMNCVPLMAAIFRHCKALHYVLIGDADQLPPIGAGRVFQDIVNAGAAPLARLAHNYRTGCAGIKLLCDCIRQGSPLTRRFDEILNSSGVQFVACVDADQTEAAAKACVEALRDGRSPNDVAILTPLKQGERGTRAINLRVRELLDFPKSTIVEGDILLVTKNNYAAQSATDGGNVAIFNGERGTAVKTGKDFIDVEFLEDAIEGPRVVRLLKSNPENGFLSGQLPENVEFGYALTVHKAQGSQFEAVIAPIAKAYQLKGIVQRSAVYTQLSRAQELLILVGDAQTLFESAACGEKPRHTLLEKLLAPESAPVPQMQDNCAEVRARALKSLRETSALPEKSGELKEQLARWRAEHPDDGEWDTP